MGFLQWIKKEIDTSNNYIRRQSEPPPIARSGSSRDDSYVKALSKFNEWRQRQIFGSSTRHSKKSSRLYSSKKAISRNADDIHFHNSNKDADELHGSNVNSLSTSNHYEEIQSKSENSIKNNKQKRKASKLFSARHSFPINCIQRNKNSSPVIARDTRKNQIYENEITEFENNYLHQSQELNISANNIHSPPVKFYKENSNPFLNVKSPIRLTSHSHYSTPSRLILNDLFKTEISSTKISGERSTTVNQHSDFQITKLSFQCEVETNTNIENYQAPVQSSKYLPYQTIINKHGDEVEYALPLNECDTSQSIISTNGLESTRNIQEYVEENFNFLNETKLNHSLFIDSSSSFAKAKVPVTDLDKTDGTLKTISEGNNGNEYEIIQELESLEMWSKSLGIYKSADRSSFNKSLNSATFKDLQSTELLVCNSNNIQIQENFTPKCLNGKYYHGTFHNVPITKYVSECSKDIGVADKVLRLNFEFLRRIRHPDIALLMGVSTDNTGKLNSLILEPLKSSLNHILYKDGYTIPEKDCLSYILQINKAVTYMHESGIVHSNISSHSIVMCQFQNSVKLTSFELATKCDESLSKEISLRFSGTFSNLDMNEIPTKYIPHYLEFRKLFAEHFYQPPELLATESKFVFPTKQSDTYGLVLTLWEILNCSIPFALFSHDDMKKLFYLKHAQLPIFNEERCRPFQDILQMGLELNSEERIQSTVQLQQMLKDVSHRLNTGKPERPLDQKDQSLPESFTNLLSPKACGDVIYDRTSTIKKRKNVMEKKLISAKQLFLTANKMRNNIDDNHNRDNNSGSQFEMGAISLPDTPIARSNKLRKAAWLNNQSISPIVNLDAPSPQSEKKLTDCTNYLNKSPGSNKKFNVNITIFQKNDSNISSPTNQDSSESKITNHIKYWNAISNTADSIPKTNQFASSNSAGNDEEANANRSSSSDNEIISPQVNIQNTQSSIGNSRNPLQITFNDIYKNNLSSENDFENSLWKREKKKCERIGGTLERNGIVTPKRVSVKDAVNKFESFSKSICVSEKSPRNVLINKSLEELIDSIPKSLPIETTNLNPTKDNSVEKASEFEMNLPNEQPILNVSKLNITLKNNLQEKKEKSVKSFTNNENVSTCETTNEGRLSLGTTDEHTLKDNNSPMLLTLNFKSLDRRASDVGTYFIRQSTKKRDKASRHSIYGTEIFKRLTNTKTTINDLQQNDSNNKDICAPSTKFSNSKKDFKIKVGKLTCLQCGHKLFVVDDVERGESSEKGTRSELFLTPLKRSAVQSGKSTEDLYIDDDFCQDIELGANMELGTRSEIFDYTDFDIFAAEIFNPYHELLDISSENANSVS